MLMTMSILEVRPRQQSEENIETVKKIVLENRRITIKEVAEDVGISAHAIKFSRMFWP